MDNTVAANAVLTASLRFQRLPAKIRKLGILRVDNQAVSDLQISEDRREVSGCVKDDPEARVAMSFDPTAQDWRIECSRPDCGTKGRCEHAAAILRSYLQKLESAAGVTETETSKTPVAASPVTAAPPPVETNLVQAATRVLGRALSQSESRFIEAVRHLYRQCDAEGAFHESALWSLDWPGRIPSFHKISLFPQRPESEVDFWLGLRELADERGYSVPKFLQNVAASGSLDERRKQMQRERELRDWLLRLNSLSSDAAAEDLEAVNELRFRLNDRGMRIEIRTPGRDWRPLKSSEARGLSWHEGPQLESRSDLLWQSLAQHHVYGGAEVDLGSDAVLQWLGTHLRMPDLDRFFVNDSGEPFLRVAEPLRWRLSEPETADGDYRVELVTASGASPGAIHYGFFGNPPLYLTQTHLYTGPNPSAFHALDGPSAVIPARAIESGAGLRWLDAAGVSPPQRILDRIEQVPLRLRVRAEIFRNGGSPTEYCLITVRAATKDERFRHVLTDQGWRQEVSASKPLDALVRLDRSALKGVGENLAAAGFKEDPMRGGLSARITKAFPSAFRDFLDRLPPDSQVDLRGDLASLREGQVVGTLRLEAEEADPDWFDLRVVVNVEDTTLTPEEVRLLVAARGQWVRLPSRGWRRLEYQLTEREEADLARIGLTPRQLSADPQRLHALQLADPSARRFLPAPAVERIERRATELKARVTPGVPPEVQASLRPYQIEGFHFLAYLTANRFGGVLADDMGLGKTLQTLTWLAWLRSEGAAADRRTLPALVVCPKSVQDTWRSEAERFVPNLRVRVWRGGDTAPAAEGADADLHVINYAQLRSAEESLAKTDFLAVILDEGQNIKNPSSLTAQVARRLRADHRLVLTGTPIENRLLDLWSLFAFAMPGVLGNRAGFHRLYDSREDSFARPRLAARVRPFLLRRTKAQVAPDLPDRVEEDLYCEMEGEQRTLYRAELKAAQQHLLRLQTEEALQKDRFHLLSSLLRLRQICCHPGLLKPDTAQDGAKLEALMETLEPLMEEGEKVLVFSQFTELLALLKPALERQGWKQWYLAGDTEDRGDLVREFQSHEGAGVFLISLKAGGAGLNLTAASYVILFDPWWNPAVENQAIDRTHRIGQARKILAYRLLIKDSIEEKIRTLQKTKRALADEVLGEERFSAALTLDDLRFLLGTDGGNEE